MAGVPPAEGGRGDSDERPLLLPPPALNNHKIVSYNVMNINVILARVVPRNVEKNGYEVNPSHYDTLIVKQLLA